MVLGQVGVWSQGGVPCDLSHHAFDVTCILPPHQLRLNTSAAAYILLAHCMLGYHTPHPPVNRMNDRHLQKHNLCKLRLQAVMNGIFGIPLVIQLTLSIPYDLVK